MSYKLVLTVYGKGTVATADQVLATLAAEGYEGEDHVMAAQEEDTFVTGTWRVFDTADEVVVEVAKFDKVNDEAGYIAKLDEAVGSREYAIAAFVMGPEPVVEAEQAEAA